MPINKYSVNINNYSFIEESRDFFSKRFIFLNTQHSLNTTKSINIFNNLLNRTRATNLPLGLETASYSTNLINSTFFEPFKPSTSEFSSLDTKATKPYLLSVSDNELLTPSVLSFYNKLTYTSTSTDLKYNLKLNNLNYLTK